MYEYMIAGTTLKWHTRPTVYTNTIDILEEGYDKKPLKWIGIIIPIIWL